MKRLAIGWYCPFTFPPLDRFEGVELVRIEYEDYINGSLGNVKLCRKMSMVRNMIVAGTLDGIVMSDCCNFSRAIYDLLVKENPHTPIYYLKIPRIVDSLFYEILQKEWISLEHWLNRLPAYNVYERKQNNEAVGNKVNKKYVNAVINAVDSRSVAWCWLDEKVKKGLQDLSWKNAIDILIKNVYCTRLVKGGALDGAGRKIKQYYDILINDIDRECINQNYYTCILSHAVEEESR